MANGPRLTLHNGGEDRASLPLREPSGDADPPVADLPVADLPVADLPVADLPVERVGQVLCKARQRKGKQLGEVWLELKIRPQHLIAIEEGRFEALPGRIYAIGFVRSYAAYLGLDAEDCVHRLKAEIAQSGAPDVLQSEGVMRGDSRAFSLRRAPNGAIPVRSIMESAVGGAFGAPHLGGARRGDPRALHTESAMHGDPRAWHAEDPEPVPSEPIVGRFSLSERNVQQSGRVVVGLVLVGLIYAGAYIFASAGRISPPPVIPVPERLLAEIRLPLAPVAVPPLAKVEHEAPAATVEREAPAATVEREAPVLPVEPVLPPLPQAIEVTPARAVSLPALPAPDVEAPAPRDGRYGVQNRNSRITLRVHRRTRVAVLGARNRDFIDRILAPGDTYRVPNMSGLRLTAADAGAIELILDGIPVGFAGKRGVRARGFPLTPQSLVRLRLTSAD